MLISNTQRLLVVDDDVLIHQLFKFCFSDEYDFQCAFSGDEALDLAEKEEFPVVMLDLNLPGASGMEILPKLRARNPHQKIIILTGHASRKSAISALNQGAFKYIEKPFVRAEIHKAIKEGVSQYSEERSRVSGWTGSKSELVHLGLSRKEAEVARLVVQGGTNQEIAVRLSLSRRSIEKHLENIFSKLNIHSRTKLGKRLQELRHPIIE